MDKKKSRFRVGYGKPPHETRFKPGQSGNPSGRPKKQAITLAEAITKELNTSITVTEGGKSKNITKLVAIAKQQTNKALKGDHRATGLVMKAVAPRDTDTNDSLSPLVLAMRAIYAKHEIAHQDGNTQTASSGLIDKTKNDDEEQP